MQRSLALNTIAKATPALPVTARDRFDTSADRSRGRWHADAMDIDINELRVFKTVVEENGFNRAARKLHRTQSAVSQSVANLEHKCDTRLILRGPPLSLTAAGERLLDHATVVLREQAAVLGAGSEISVAVFETMRRALDQISLRLHARLARVDALVAPTTLISPPPIADLEADDDAYAAANGGALHNTSLGNVLRVCAITLPCGGDDNGMPVGLMLHARPFTEAALLRLSAACEAALAAIPKPSPTSLA